MAPTSALGAAPTSALGAAPSSALVEAPSSALVEVPTAALGAAPRSAHRGPARAWLYPAPAAPAADRVHSWTLPLAGHPAVLRAFEPPATDWGRGHRGVDLAARPGQEVLAAGPGVVTWAGRFAGRGVLTVTHDAGLRTTYEPVSAIAAVGRRVSAGTVIGVLEATGDGGHCGTASCLHWGLLRGADYLDPLALVRGRSPVLLPLGITGAARRASPAGPA